MTSASAESSVALPTEPASPEIWSSPARPQISSGPAPPSSVSGPSPPMTTSFSAPPVTKSWSVVPDAGVPETQRSSSWASPGTLAVVDRDGLRADDRRVAGGRALGQDVDGALTRGEERADRRAGQRRGRAADDDVGAVAAVHRVDPGAADHHVAAVEPDADLLRDHVRRGAARPHEQGADVSSGSADEAVVAGLAVHPVGARTALDPVVARSRPAGRRGRRRRTSCRCPPRRWPGRRPARCRWRRRRHRRRCRCRRRRRR